jgi:hypothetical protein
LRYFLPADERSLAIERARIALSSRAQIDPGVKEFFGRLEPGMRAVAAMGLEGFIASESMNATVDLVRLWTSGIAISAVEHPEIWTPERQFEALEHFMRSLELPRAVTAATRDWLKGCAAMITRNDVTGGCVSMSSATWNTTAAASNSSSRSWPPNRCWVADLTHVKTWSDVVYVAFVVDTFSRRIVGWSAATSKAGRPGNGSVATRP